VPRNEAVFVGELTTVGRKTGVARTVKLRMIYLDGKFYACSSNVQGKHWCRNMLKNPAVELRAGKELFRCKSRRVTEEPLRMRVLNLRDSAPLAERVVFELAPETRDAASS
jgi:deazaflavin-dependent oxidoreductase (nitroreductase family)